jgi:hypothetical protein
MVSHSRAIKHYEEWTMTNSIKAPLQVPLIFEEVHYLKAIGGFQAVSKRPKMAAKATTSKSRQGAHFRLHIDR